MNRQEANRAAPSSGAIVAGSFGALAKRILDPRRRR